ncbi:hypothetical protein Dsin_023037 [Dipteronia sinensis]|uniref:Uncharacterized protein n=1 Tax=Dipteronia sinensis TaxID=43782 RepID=A0AAE0A3H6_9ROSI|nr:hypothetical protein Dsin_023037 [Dipteronia sinensis]
MQVVERGEIIFRMVFEGAVEMLKIDLTSPPDLVSSRPSIPFGSLDALPSLRLEYAFKLSNRKDFKGNNLHHQYSERQADLKDLQDNA